jgi:hypothetical protein
MPVSNSGPCSGPRARCVPVRTGNPGNSRPTTDISADVMSCNNSAQHACTRSLLSSGSRVRILPGAPDQWLSGPSNACRWDPKAYPAVDLGFSPAGTRIRKKVSGKAKVEVRGKLKELHKELDEGCGRSGGTR